MIVQLFNTEDDGSHGLRLVSRFNTKKEFINIFKEYLERDNEKSQDLKDIFEHANEDDAIQLIRKLFRSGWWFEFIDETKMKPGEYNWYSEHKPSWWD